MVHNRELKRMGKKQMWHNLRYPGIWLEELSETTRNIGQEVGVSHEIQTGHFRMQVRRHTAWMNLLHRFGSPRTVSYCCWVWRHFNLSMKTKPFSWRSITTYTYRGADKSLARPGRKQAGKHVRDARDFNKKETRAVMKFLSLQGKAPKEIHAILTETLAFPSWSG